MFAASIASPKLRLNVAKVVKIHVCQTDRKPPTTTLSYRALRERRQLGAALSPQKLCTLRRCSQIVTSASSSDDSALHPTRDNTSEIKNQMKRYKDAAARISANLREMGMAGMVAYGLLNTLYYVIAFSIGWTQFADVRRGVGIGEAVKQFLQVMAMVWAGSQVTKLPRLACAAFMAPIVDKGAILVAERFNLQSKQSAFLATIAICLLVASVVFGGVVLTCV
ncbi:hypothetical protein CYMTET_22939 [Cymbomonas tetramitiformis]|uniref:Uncharacterized protein n=1 Tax=Cymbomonas tetramitiformis TaxID=36881 RepID=A0AAE0L1S9_9CHLO|nr:hypothetical protein CYMTET_22939 [Cymbomonas tetramitiformis]